MTEENTQTTSAIIDIDRERILREMNEARVCFGRSTSRLHPKMKPYIIGAKNTQTIIDLEKTYDMLIKAKEFFQNSLKEHKIILFVNINPATNDITLEAAQKTNNPYVINCWVGGFLTNFSEISKRIKYYNELIQKNVSGELEKYTKKEQLKFKKELEDLADLFSGVKDLSKLPDAIFVIGARFHETAIKEAQKMHIPIIALANTDTDIEGIDYPIVGSDLHRSSVEYITNFLIS